MNDTAYVRMIDGARLSISSVGVMNNFINPFGIRQAAAVQMIPRMAVEARLYFSREFILPTFFAPKFCDIIGWHA